MSNVKQFKCPYCDADLKFSADKQKFACEYCLSEFEEKELLEIENKNKPTEEAAKQQDEFEQSTNLYLCPSCGAEIMSDANTAATFCYYCHNPVILKGRVSGDFRPSKVLPFAIGKEKAESIFKDWAKKKWFAPSDFVSGKQVEKMTGLYVPFWVTEQETTSNLDAIGRKVRHWSDKHYNYTETSEFKVERRGNIAYHGLPADGSQKIEDDIMEAIEPFDYTKAKDFSMAYLSGFLADKYDVDKKMVFPRIAERVKENNLRVLKDSAPGYNSISVVNFDTRFNKVDWQYMLLPVWFMTYKYGGKHLEYAINGQSGKISGRIPLSMPKTLGFCAALALIVLIIFVVIGRWLLL